MARSLIETRTTTSKGISDSFIEPQYFTLPVEGRRKCGHITRLTSTPEDVCRLMTAADMKQRLPLVEYFERAVLCMFQVIVLEMAWKSKKMRKPSFLLRPNPYYVLLARQLVEKQKVGPIDEIFSLVHRCGMHLT